METSKAKLRRIENKYNSMLCPITKQIFLEPVTAEDGMIYERSAIEAWVYENGTSPITGKQMSLKLYPTIMFKNKVSEYLEKHPQYKDQRYQKISQEFKKYKNKICAEIATNKFDNLMNYIGYDLILCLPMNTYNDSSREYLFETICKNCKNDTIIAHVINNSIDLNAKLPYGKSPIHSVCKYCSLNILKLMISKNVNLKKSYYGKYPIHIVCESGDENIIKCLIDAGVDLNCRYKDRFSRSKPPQLPIDYIVNIL